MFYVWDELGNFPPIEGENVMISAGSAWNNPGKGFTAHIPKHDDLFIDSGGFQASSEWNGKYPYSPEEYMDWAESIGADYVAGMDFACEEEISDISLENRLQMTVEKQAEQAEVYENNGYDFVLVPVIQGRNINHYLESIDHLRESGLFREYMAMGSLCIERSSKEIGRIIRGVCDVMPSNIQIHLFGAKISVLGEKKLWGLFDSHIRSMDTAAWKFLPSNARSEGGMYVRNKKEKIFAFRQYQKKVRNYQETIRSQRRLK